MLRVVGCITEQHDLRFVVVAALLCLFACFTAMSAISRARVSPKTYRLMWLGVAGIVAGAGIWGTHFVAMLAYRTGLPMGYDAGMTVLSILLAASMCAVGFGLAISRAGPVIGGLVTGAAISAMHYVGMSGVNLPAIPVWDLRYVMVSVLIGVAVTAVAMPVALKRGDTRSNVYGALLFTLAICGMHFTAMAAVTYWPDPTVQVSAAILDPPSLAVAVAAVAALIVALGLIGALVDHHLASRASKEAERLRVYVAELEVTKHQLEQTSHNLHQALNEAAAANKAKSDFMAAMSHELRTPLNAVIGFSEMLGGEIFGPLGHPRYKEYVEDIRTSGVHLLALINDLLDLSRLDAGQLELANENVDLADVVAEALRIVRPRAQNTHIRLFEAIEAPELAVHGDRRRIRQVLINLLANAVKFTPEKGTVRVTIRRQGDEAAIIVADTGIGIAKEDIQKVFERFHQIDSSRARKYEGAGLGLPLSAELMALHGGRLEMESTLQVGTTVTMLFPRERVVLREEAAA
jgi:signal transduction histidine kinase